MMQPQDRLRIVVGGFVGLIQGGGVAWDYLQYPMGLSMLGHDVWYLEDTGVWPLYQPAGSDSTDCGPTVRQLHELLENFGLDGRWAYRDEVTGHWFGINSATRREIFTTADVFLNLSCSTVMRDELASIPVRVLVDTDPMFTQLQMQLGFSFTPGGGGLRDVVAAHTHHATFGERLGAEECAVPLCGIDWIPTRQPICLSSWPVMKARDTTTFTTVMNWSVAKPLEFAGVTWGQKDVEILRMLELPKHVPTVRLELALGNLGVVPERQLRNAGWELVDASTNVADWLTYRAFIQQSAGEIGFAKEAYVKSRSGWFSCRSACYLASGRPVIAQDTGWSGHLPTGSGLMAFSEIDEAADALNAVTMDYSTHSVAARRLAEEHFDAKLVLTQLLGQVIE